MWFKEFNEHAVLVKPVAEVRPFLQKHYEKLGRQLSAPMHTMLHYYYVMTIQQVTPDTKLPNKPTGLRLLESDAGGPIAIHEVSLNKQKPELLETFYSQTYLKNFVNAVGKMKEKEPDQTKGEIRYLCIPALNVDILWLHHEEDNADSFISIWDLAFKQKEIYSKAKFVSLINEMKYKQDKKNGPKGA